MEIPIPDGTFLVGTSDSINSRAVPSISARTVTNINPTFDSKFQPGYNSTMDTTDNPSITSGSVLDADATKNLYPLQC